MANFFKFFGLGKSQNDEFEDDFLEDEEFIEEEDEWQTPVDVIEFDDKIVLLAPIAGLSLDDIDISLDKTILQISWERKEPDFYSDWELKNSECYFWKFKRNIILPDNLDWENITAVMEHNMLEITVPKLIYKWKTIKINQIEK